MRWGLKSSLEKLATSPEEFVIRRYDGKKLLGERRGFADEMLDKFGSYYWDMHRADLQLAMFEQAKSLGVRFQFGTPVTDIRPEIPELTTDKGDFITGDLIVAADGGSFYRICDYLPKLTFLLRALVQGQVGRPRQAQSSHPNRGSRLPNRAQDERSRGPGTSGVHAEAPGAPVGRPRVPRHLLSSEGQ